MGIVICVLGELIGALLSGVVFEIGSNSDVEIQSVSFSAENADCPVCARPVGPSPHACPKCATPHHLECWKYLHGCAIYGCFRGLDRAA
jgi:hypothetical protein